MAPRCNSFEAGTADLPAAGRRVVLILLARRGSRKRPHAGEAHSMTMDGNSIAANRRSGRKFRLTILKASVCMDLRIQG
jgi:hypothetical protein